MNSTYLLTILLAEFNSVEVYDRFSLLVPRIVMSGQAEGIAQPDKYELMFGAEPGQVTFYKGRALSAHYYAPNRYGLDDTKRVPTTAAEWESALPHYLVPVNASGHLVTEAFCEWWKLMSVRVVPSGDMNDRPTDGVCEWFLGYLYNVAHPDLPEIENEPVSVG